MIKNKSRKGWFGASDTKFIVGSYDTQTFKLWWLTKVGYTENNFKNKYTETGNAYEHKIAELIRKAYKCKLKLDKQIKIRRLKLRVNLDANTRTVIHEIKTTKKHWNKLPKPYWQQCQVQMYADRRIFGRYKDCYLQAYLVDNEYYDNYLIELKEDRLKTYYVELDLEWLNNEYLPRLKYLVKCLKHKKIPTNKEFKNLQIK